MRSAESESRRARMRFACLMIKLDPAALEQVLMKWLTEGLGLTIGDEQLRAVVLEGKALRGTRAKHKQSMMIIATFDLATDSVLSQTPVDVSTNESATALKLVKEMILEGRESIGDGADTITGLLRGPSESVSTSLQCCRGGFFCVSVSDGVNRNWHCRGVLASALCDSDAFDNGIRMGCFPFCEHTNCKNLRNIGKTQQRLHGCKRGSTKQKHWVLCGFCRSLEAFS
ncbi:MAG: hypothetical protein KDA89_18115 [Planctomycetaceae bacterium]|nr:hypothetical protein [Planctomycetaceae bacterium]